MGKTMIEKIIELHVGRSVKPGDIVDMEIDARLARDFGGANVVKNLEEYGLKIDDPRKTFFTFDCNPGGSDQKYAANQHICRLFARTYGIRVYDINMGIGTHLAIDEGFIYPSGTLVSTDSHANLVGAVGAFGQGMGDLDIAYAFARGKIWFRVPPTVRIVLRGEPPTGVSPKDVTLFLVKHFGPSDLLGYAAEIWGRAVEQFSLSDRITLASMGTEMGAISILIPPSAEIIEYARKMGAQEFNPVYADEDTRYEEVVELDISDLSPLVSRPGKPHDAVPVEEVAGKKIDSIFIGSCTNGRFEDMMKAAQILEGRIIAPGVVLKVVPATDRIWNRCMREGIFSIFKEAGALIGNAGCAGCAAGQIGQNGPGEVTISTGNRNFPGKQGKGEVWLASPSTAAASAVAGHITTQDEIPEEPSVVVITSPPRPKKEIKRKIHNHPTTIEGRVWVIPKDDIDTDMIYHNHYLAVTDIREMGEYAFSNLSGWEDFPKKVKSGDIIITGKNFGCGSSRQHAVDCFRALKIGLIIAKSFGSIYERNAINSGFPIMVADVEPLGLKDGDIIRVDFMNGEIKKLETQEKIIGKPFFETQLWIYRKGGLLE